MPIYHEEIVLDFADGDTGSPARLKDSTVVVKHYEDKWCDGNLDNFISITTSGNKSEVTQHKHQFISYLRGR